MAKKKKAPDMAKMPSRPFKPQLPEKDMKARPVMSKAKARAKVGDGIRDTAAAIAMGSAFLAGSAAVGKAVGDKQKGKR
jgi:hypothetical protein